MGMITDIFGHKCMFCGKRSRTIESVLWDRIWKSGGSVYIKVYRHYHRYSCLAKILKSPDTFEERTVRLALKTIDKIRSEAKGKKRDERTDIMRKFRKLSNQKHRNEKAKEAYRKMS